MTRPPWTPYREIRLRREAARRRREAAQRQNTPEAQAQRTQRMLARWSTTFALLAASETRDCSHPEIVPCRTHDDGSVDGRCTACGADSFPLVDVNHELWTLTAEGYPSGPRRPRGTARQRRITRQQRMQQARRWARWRRGLRGEP